jgi:FkbM family methyltransferase
MSSYFLSAYFRVLGFSFFNSHNDNYDFNRFGPLLEDSRNAPYARRPRDIVDAIRAILTYHARFMRLYNSLADDASRDILVRVLAYRTLGYRKVKLPLNTPLYWNDLRRMEELAKNVEIDPIGSANWQLRLIDLEPFGVPAKMFTTPTGPYTTFVLEQYRCKSHRTDITVEPGDYVIDAGACWGDTALYFAHRSGSDGMVFSYEFSPDNLEILKKNLSLNPDLADRIQIVERAVWDRSDLTLSANGAGPGARVSTNESTALHEGPQTLSIDDLVQRRNLPRVNFIKMDIEGAELPALRGAAETIKRFKPKLAISVYHRLTDFFEVPEFLDSLRCNYEFFLRHYTIHAEETVLFATVKK